MKRSGRHPDKELTALQVKQAKQAGRYADGNGLYLVVEPSGAKRWLLRVVVQGRRRDLGLGGAGLVSLAEARDRALQYRKIAREGGDPVALRRQADDVPTFAEAAERVHSEREPGWRNAKHATQWLSTLERYAYPEIGKLSVAAIGTPDVLRVLSPIWLSKPETARRVRQRVGAVLDWAKAAGFRSGDNPVDGVNKGLPKQQTGDKHHTALPFKDVPAFVQKLRASNSSDSAREAFEFLILTACRTGEVLYAKWPEFDLKDAVWTVPAERMKAKRAYRVPLARRALAIVETARDRRRSDTFVFPSAARDRPLSNMVFLATLKRMDAPVTAHGFRSAFRDWAAETTSFPREVVEMALAHTVANKVEAAYRRGDLLEKRRSLMEAWEAFVTGNLSSQRDSS